MDLGLLPAHQLVGLLREKKVGCVELLEQHIQRLAARNPALNAVVATNFELARARAAQADAALARGESWGPLHGLPMTIKDTIEVTGMPTTAGAPALKDYKPRANAPVVQRLLDAGAVIFGKTNVPLYAGDLQTFNDVYGTTRSPWDPARTPGGSSGGAAAALAAGLTPLEIGSDIGGSIRTPAHFCGVYGHKPSSGLVPARGHIPGPPGTIAEADLMTIGPMGRSADDLELALRVIAGPLAPAAAGWQIHLPPARQARFAAYRVHAWLDDPSCTVDSSVRTVLEATVDKLRQQGCSVVTGAPKGFSLDELYELYFSLLCGVFAAGLPEAVYRRARMAGTVASWLGRDKPNTLPGFLRRATLSHRQWLRLNETRERLRLKFEEFFQNCDVLLTPVARIAAPPHTQEGSLYTRTIQVDGKAEPYASQFVWISPATVGGLPACSAPVGLTSSGLPVGVQIISSHLHDLTTIGFARRLAELTGGFRAPPG